MHICIYISIYIYISTTSPSEIAPSTLKLSRTTHRFSDAHTPVKFGRVERTAPARCGTGEFRDVQDGVQ